MARQCPAGNAPEAGEIRNGGFSGFASFFWERSWVTCWIFSDQYALCLAMAQKGWLRRASVTLLDAVGGWTGQRSWQGVAPGGHRLLSSPEGVSVRYRNNALSFQQEGSALRVFGCADRFREDQPLLFDLRLTAPQGSGAEMPVLVPGHARGLSQRRVTGGLRAEGRAEISGEEYLFAPAHSVALMEEGIGGRRIDPSGNRATAAGWIEGAPAALLLDGAAQENMLLMAGRTWELGAVSWVDPSLAARLAEKIAASDVPRRFVSADGRVALAFDPLAEQLGARRRLFQRKAEEIQVFGHFSGQIRLENGRTVLLRRLSGVVLRQDKGKE